MVVGWADNVERIVQGTDLGQDMGGQDFGGTSIIDQEVALQRQHSA